MSTHVPLHLRRADKWRSAYNALRSLDIQRAVSLIEQGELGIYADLQWTYRGVEKRNATLRGLKRLRLAAIGRLDWDAKAVDETPQAAAQRKALRALYDGIENLTAALRFLALAEFRGFAHLEIRHRGDDPSAPIRSLDPVEQWFWCRDGYLGRWLYNPEAAPTQQGEPIDAARLIVREVEDPIDEIGLLCHVAEGLGKKDWAGFVDTFGIPPLFGELPQDVPEGQADAYQSMLEAVVSDFRGTHPHGAKVYTLDAAGGRGASPFKEFLDYQREELVLAGTSGKLTMLNGPTGLGSGQSETHQDVFDDLASAEAAEISELLQQAIDKPFLERMFPGQPILAYFDLAAQDQEDAGVVLDHAAKAVAAGFRIVRADLAEKTGYELEDLPAPQPPPAPGPFGPAAAFRAAPLAPPPPAQQDPEGRAAALAAIEQARAARYAPLQPYLRAVEEAEDPAAWQQALEALDAAIDAEAPGIMADPQLGQAWEAALGAAAASAAIDRLTAPRN